MGNVSAKERSQTSPATLVLYAKSKAPVPERDWVLLVQSIAAGDQTALHALYERAHRVVFTLIVRITANRETAEELTIDVFHDICRRELEGIRALVGRFVAWPADVLRPAPSLQTRLAQRIAKETGKEPVLPPTPQWSEPPWEQVAPGIESKLLAADTERDRVGMLVRLAPGASYPAHTHADVEELHLLDGELWIDHRKLVPGDYNYGAPGASDRRVWSETGCTCVLVTSSKDMLHAAHQEAARTSPRFGRDESW